MKCKEQECIGAEKCFSESTKAINAAGRSKFDKARAHFETKCKEGINKTMEEKKHISHQEQLEILERLQCAMNKLGNSTDS